MAKSNVTPTADRFQLAPHLPKGVYSRCLYFTKVGSSIRRTSPDVCTTDKLDSTMQLQMTSERAANYKSASQRARVLSEAWARDNLYCVRCSSPSLRPAPPNAKVVDFVCPSCEAPFQLKSQARAFSRRICDSAFEPMRHAILENQAPNLFALHYDRARWNVLNLIFIPSFALTLSSLERRKPLGPQARRKGWVGCNILLTNIPADARIVLVSQGTAVSSEAARHLFARLRGLETLPHDRRGWTLDVLNTVRSLGKARFTLSDVYSYSGELQRLHPRNRHVREKIRQQLQQLRDMGLVEFVGRGSYALKPS